MNHSLKKLCCRMMTKIPLLLRSPHPALWALRPMTLKHLHLGGVHYAFELRPNNDPIFTTPGYSKSKCLLSQKLKMTSNRQARHKLTDLCRIQIRKMKKMRCY